MASNINPQNIDGAYPVAGQDNDSQGFRDNFTNTKTNFGYASAEITDLQNKVVLKAPLIGTTLNNNMGGSILSNAQLQNVSETRVSLGTVAGAQTINFAAGPYYTVTTSGSISLAFTNLPPVGAVARIRLRITISSVAHTLTLPSAVSIGTNSIQGLVANVITFSVPGTYEFEFETDNQGASFIILDQSRNVDPMYLSSAQLDAATGTAISLTTTTTTFQTTAAETTTLANGGAGQIKILVLADNNDDGSSMNTMTVTVASAGWNGGSSGTITLEDRGNACTLIFLGGAWWCVGNNSAVFA